ncbi:MAG: GNAT family N-acetyltransferase [Neptuniibacter sp.]
MNTIKNIYKNEGSETVEFSFQIHSGKKVPTLELKKFYKKNGHKGRIEVGDTCAWLSTNHSIVAALRLSPSHTSQGDYLLLRSLWVAKELRGQSLGSNLLKQVTRYLHENRMSCYCLTYPHLNAFYLSNGFIAISDDEAPTTLAQRFKRYKKRGDRFIIMKLKPK